MYTHLNRGNELNPYELLDNVETMILILDKNERIIYANRFAVEKVGFNESEFQDKTFTQIFSLLSKKKNDRYIQKLIKLNENNSCGNFKTDILTKDGKVIKINWKYRRMNDDHSDEFFIFTGIEEIGINRPSDEVKEHFEEFISSSIDVFWEMDRKFRITYISAADEKLRGYRSEEVIGCQIWDLLTENSAKMVKNRIEKIQAEFGQDTYIPGSRVYELELITKDGEGIWLELVSNTVFDEAGNFSGFRGISRDISIRKKLEIEKARIYQLYTSLINASPDAIMVLDTNGIFLFVSHKTLELFHIKNDVEIIGTNVIDWIDIAERERLLENFEKSYIGLKDIDNRYTILRKDGSRFFGEIMSAVLKTTLGEIEGIICIARDVTYHKSMEEERISLINKLENANEELQKLSRMKDDFLSLASHDLRSPFHALLGFAELLLSDPELGEKQKELVSLMNITAEKQLYYLDDLLDILQLESGHIKLKLEKTKMHTIILESINLLNMLAVKKQINLKFQQCCSLCNKQILADVPKMSQVINNLISNAIKYTPKGGNIQITCCENEGKIEVHVIDNGIGIPEDSMENLFTRYGQMHSSGTDGEKSTGLGLAICKNLIEIHQGTIHVKSKPGKGSDFYFIIPITD